MIAARWSLRGTGSIRRSGRRKPRRAGATPRWAWLVPPLLIVAIVAGLFKGSTVLMDLAYVLGGVAFVLAVRNPVAALRVGFVLIGVHMYVMAFLFHHGIPASLVKNLALYKEAIAGAVVVAGVRNLAKPGRRLDTLDWLCIGYFGLSLVYLLAPGVFRATITGLGTSDRLTYWRTDVIGVLMVFGCRHLELTRDDVHRLLRAVFVGTGLVVLSGVLQLVAAGTWDSLSVNTFGVPLYSILVLHVWTNPTSVIVHGSAGVRVGGTLSYLTIGGYVTTAAAVLLHWTSSRRLPRYAYALLAGCAVVVIFSQARTGMISLALAGLLTTWSTTQRPERLKLRLALVFVLGVIVVVPLLVSSGAINRVLGKDTVSNAGHASAFHTAINAIRARPFGYGLGSSAGAARFGSNIDLVTENQYLQYGVEMGVITMGLFFAIVLALFVRLRLASRDDPADTDTPGIFAAFVGVLVSSWFLHVLNEAAVSFTVFGMAGVALAVYESRRARALARGAQSAPRPLALAPQPVPQAAGSEAWFGEARYP